MNSKLKQKNVPKGWQATKLASIGSFSKGAAISKEQLSEDGHNAVRYGELYTKHHFQIKKIYSFISDDIVPLTKKIKYGDILFAGSGETIDEIGKSAAYLLKKDGYAGGDTIIFKPKNANSLFLSYFLNVGEGRKKLRELGQGQSVVHIYKSDIENLKLHLPSIPEQNRIVAVLETWDRAIEKLVKKIAIKKEIKKGLMRGLLTGKTRLPGFTEKWKTQPLSSLGIFSKGAGILKDQVLETGLNAVRYGELYTKYDYHIQKVYSFISKNVVSQTKKIKFGDILFAGSGETIDEIGKSAAYLLHEEGYAGGDIIIFSPKNCDSRFLSYFLNVGESRKKLRELGQGQSVVHLYKRDLEKMKLYIPFIKEQKAIADILTAADKEIKELEQKLLLVKEQERHLLNNLITGTIRTPENMKIQK